MKLEYVNTEDKEFYIWGNGNVLRRYLKQLPVELQVKAIVDSDESKWGCTDIEIAGRILNCISPMEVKEGEHVIIAVEDVHIVDEIKNILEKRDIFWCHIYEVVDKNILRKVKYKKEEGIYDLRKIVKFIDTIIPVYSCNLACDYCYLGQNKTKFDHLESIYHDPKYIRYALSKKRLGGIAFINFCGAGETLLSRYIIGIVKELVAEGHYIQIVTNATISQRINEFIEAQIDMSHVFFKCSLHYRQLIEKNLLGVFEENVQKLKAAGASVTVELVPEDDLVPYIDEVKRYCMEKFGAFPHVSVARDERCEDFRILSKYSREEYERIWGTFESQLFTHKMSHFECQKNRDCKAGLWSGELNLASGELTKCIVANQRLCNIYENIEEDIYFERVGKNCPLPYCINNHVYLTLGLIPEIKTSTYLEMRDRVCQDGTHWITDEMREVLEQKLYDNCEESILK